MGVDGGCDSSFHFQYRTETCFDAKCSCAELNSERVFCVSVKQQVYTYRMLECVYAVCSMLEGKKTLICFI